MQKANGDGGGALGDLITRGEGGGARDNGIDSGDDGGAQSDWVKMGTMTDSVRYEVGTAGSSCMLGD